MVESVLCVCVGGVLLCLVDGVVCDVIGKSSAVWAGIVGC
jgi:hypothetical protein